ncbi:hypothetical protein C162_21983 [Paenibacillus sp. FSL R7-269]|uniref:helix-turn-helix transcriptional regulator n=1 Tax=Paenibacillus sp. FSL R7-269 TaxID=1226755 RepID=UPI0003E1F125|nr:helix-turn-helix transcriptional regulator [Paenibacillus sp. FSL R7-269]ETT45251.1 hypothetical protein C162_21983 [Paenibacillus sp. FSL R7-269]
MEYKELLKSYIDKSGLSLREIEEQMRIKGFSTNKAYISKLQNGVHPPAGEDITRALAEVTGGDIDALLLAGYIEKAPDEIKSILTEASNTGELFSFFGTLVMYLEEFRSKGKINEELLEKIEMFNNVFAADYKHRLALGPLKEHPEYATVLIAQLKRHFLPMTNSIIYRGVEIKLSDYVDEAGEPIFKNNPYPEMIKNAEEDYKEIRQANQMQIKESSDNGYFRSVADIKNELTQKKIQFFEDLEGELGFDLTDPAVQKKLKTAAKIIFSEED